MELWLTQEIRYLWAVYYDPFYWYCFIGALIIIGSTWLAWFFDLLRPLAGALSLSVVIGLLGFRKGQQQVREAQKVKKPKLRPPVLRNPLPFNPFDINTWWGHD